MSLKPHQDQELDGVPPLDRRSPEVGKVKNQKAKIRSARKKPTAMPMGGTTPTPPPHGPGVKPR